MGRLTDTALSTLDGFVEGADGRFGGAVPDPELHALADDLELVDARFASGVVHRHRRTP